MISAITPVKIRRAKPLHPYSNLAGLTEPKLNRSPVPFFSQANSSTCSYCRQLAKKEIIKLGPSSSLEKGRTDTNDNNNCSDSQTTFDRDKARKIKLIMPGRIYLT